MSSFFRSKAASTPSSAASSIKSAPRVKHALPSPTLKEPIPASKPPRTAEELQLVELYGKMLAHFSAEGFEVPKGEGKEGGKLMTGERMWLTEDCFWRYLRAQKFDLTLATQKLTDTLVWRREQGLADDDGGEGAEGGGLNAELIFEEGRSGKDYVNGWDETGRPLHYQVPSRNESIDSALNVKYCVWIMERAIDLSPPGVEKQVLLVNFSGGMAPPPLATVRGWISMLSHHYPERMGKAIAIKVPWILNAFFKLILPWIDPVTRAKLSFNEAAPWIPDDQLEEAFGGKLPFDYDQSVYFPSLIELCKERRRLYRERWVAAGSKIGTSEWYLKGGAGEPVVDDQATLAAPPSVSVEEKATVVNAEEPVSLDGLKI